MKANYSFTDDHIEQYRNEGFVVVERLFDADDLARVDATIRRMTDQALSSGDHSKVLELEPEAVDGQARSPANQVPPNPRQARALCPFRRPAPDDPQRRQVLLALRAAKSGEGPEDMNAVLTPSRRSRAPLPFENSLS